MFCENCGKENVDGAMFCEGCGNKLAQDNVPEENTAAVQSDEATVSEAYEPADNTASYAAEPEKKSFKNYLPFAIIAVVVLAIIFGAVSLFGGGPEKAIKNQVKAINKEDVGAMLKVLPKSVEKELKDNDDFTDDLKDALKSLKKSLKEEFGNDVKVTYKILDKEKIDKEDLDDYEDTINNYIESFNEEYDADIDDVEASAGYKLEVKYTFKGKKDSDSRTETAYVLKINGRWCLEDFI